MFLDNICKKNNFIKPPKFLHRFFVVFAVIKKGIKLKGRRTYKHPNNQLLLNSKKFAYQYLQQLNRKYSMIK